MAITHSTAARNAAADAVVDLLDAGGGANGQMVIADVSEVAVSTLNLSNPAYGDATNGVANGNAISNDTNATGGEAALVFMNDTNGVEVFRGTVTATGGGGDLELNDTTVAPGADVSISDHTYTSAP